MSVEAIAPPIAPVMPIDPVERVRTIASLDPVGHIVAGTSLAREEVEQFREQAEMRMPGGRVGIRMSEGALMSMLGDGRYKTFRETGKSAGHGSRVASPDHGYWMARDRYEADIFGQSPEDTPVVYGFLEEADTLTSRQEVKNGGFGKVELILRPEIRERTTFTVGESLDKTRPPILYPDAMLARQAVDAAKQRGEKIARGKDGYIEAQVFGGVALDDVEMIAIDATNIDKAMQQVATIHEALPDLPVMLRLSIAPQFGWPEGPKVMELAQQYPFVQFVGQVKAASPFRDRNLFKDGVGGKELIDNAEQSYEAAKARVAQLRTRSSEHWRQEHPGQPFPPNVSFDMLSTDY